MREDAQTSILDAAIDAVALDRSNSLDAIGPDLQGEPDAGASTDSAPADSRAVDAEAADTAAIDRDLTPDTATSNDTLTAADAAERVDSSSTPDVATGPDLTAADAGSPIDADLTDHTDHDAGVDAALECGSPCEHWSDCTQPGTGCEENLGCCVPCGAPGGPCCVSWEQGLFFCNDPGDVCGVSIGFNDQVTYYCCHDTGDGCCRQGGCSGGTCCKCPRNGLNFCVQPSFGCGGCD